MGSSSMVAIYCWPLQKQTLDINDGLYCLTVGILLVSSNKARISDLKNKIIFLKLE